MYKVEFALSNITFIISKIFVQSLLCHTQDFKIVLHYYRNWLVKKTPHFHTIDKDNNRHNNNKDRYFS